LAAKDLWECSRSVTSPDLDATVVDPPRLSEALGQFVISLQKSIVSGWEREREREREIRWAIDLGHSLHLPLRSSLISKVMKTWPHSNPP
jgi:hypothetical protein